MLKLEKRSETRVALNDEGAFIILDPITPKMRRRVLRKYAELLQSEGIDPLAWAKSDILDIDLTRDLAELITYEMIRMGAREWGGIGDADGNPVELTPDQATRLRTAAAVDRPTGTIDSLLNDEAVFAMLDAEYVQPEAQRRAEKNALSGSPPGTSTGATPDKDTANCRAKRKSTAAAPNARTKKTSSKPTKAKGSGRS